MYRDVLTIVLAGDEDRGWSPSPEIVPSRPFRSAAFIESSISPSRIVSIRICVRFWCSPNTRPPV